MKVKELTTKLLQLDPEAELNINVFIDGDNHISVAEPTEILVDELAGVTIVGRNGIYITPEEAEPLQNKELQIGEIGVIDGVRVECCKSEQDDMLVCSKCALYPLVCIHVHPDIQCSRAIRSDHTDVYFKKIEE